MNAQQLKNAILQEAIEGRLVPQDPNDEPASVLLDRIRKEKARLVKEGKLKKKDLEEIPITEDEKPFEIPESWEWVRFGAVAINRDRERIPLSVDERSTLEKRYDYYGASGVIDKVDRYLFDKPLLLIGEDGANLINRSTPIAFIARGEYWVNNHAHVLDYINEDLMQYMCWYINAISLVDYVTGTAQPKMNQEKMNSILVALPPLAEQQRIVAKIEELLPKVEEYGKAQEALNRLNAELPERLKKSILQEAIQGRLVPQDPNDEPASALLDRIRKEKAQLVKAGKLKKKDLEETPIAEEEKPFAIPESWEWVRLGEYTSKITDFVASGSFASLRENVKYYSNVEYAILVRTKDFQSKFQTDLVYTDKHGYEFLSNSNLFGGELILPNIGASIGKVFIVPTLNHRMTLAPNTIMVKFYKGEHRDWIFTLFNSGFGKKLLCDISSSTAQGKFNKTDLKKVAIPIPPLAEQQRIVAKIEELLGAINALP